MLPRKASTKKRRSGARALSPLERWGRTQEWGWKTRLMERTVRKDKPAIAWATICRACRGIKVNLSTAKRLSKATGGAVPFEALTDERDDLDEVA